MTCDKAGAGDWQPVGLSAATVTTVRPMLAAAVSRERAQGNCWHDRMVLAAFLPRVPGLARVRSTRARPPRCNFGPRGLCVMVGSGAQFRSGLATTNVWLPEKVKCG